MGKDRFTINTESYYSITELIQAQVNSIFVKRFDEEPNFDFRFIVSLDGEKGENIYLTIINGQSCYSERIFPSYKNSYYGLESLEDIMERLFNRSI